MKFDFKTGLILFFIIMGAVYVANMWTHKMIEKEEQRKAKELQMQAWLQQQSATA